MKKEELIKKCFYEFISTSNPKEIVTELEDKYSLSRAYILKGIKLYASNEATKLEYKMYQKQIHIIDPYVDYKQDKKMSSYCFKYYDILKLLADQLDKYILSSDYSIIINYLETLNKKNILNKDTRKRYYKYLEINFGKDVSNYYKEKIEFMYECYKIYQKDYLIPQRLKIANHKNAFIQAKRYMDEYILRLANNELFIKSDMETIEKYMLFFKQNYPKLYEKYLEKQKLYLENIKEKEIKEIYKISFLFTANNFNLLDYYIKFNYDLLEVKNKVSIYGLHDCAECINNLYYKSKHKTPLNELFFYKLSYKVILQGNEYTLSNIEKQQLFKFLIENNIPRTVEMMNLAVKKYIKGEINLDDCTNKIATKKNS